MTIAQGRRTMPSGTARQTTDEYVDEDHADTDDEPFFCEDQVGHVEPNQLAPPHRGGERALQGVGELSVAVARTEVRCLALPRSAFSPPGQDGSPPSLQSFVPRASLDHSACPWVGQQEEADCDAAALAMVARRHGMDVSPEQVRRLVPVGPMGASLTDLEKAALALGLHCLVARVVPGQLTQVQTPFLAHMSGGHYVAVFDLAESVVVVGDPASGVVRLSRSVFAQTCSGKLLLARPTAAR